MCRLLIVLKLIKAAGNIGEVTLSLRTRAERISFMLLFHLTLILKKATSERSHVSLLESDEVAASHPSPLSAASASRV